MTEDRIKELETFQAQYHGEHHKNEDQAKSWWYIEGVIDVEHKRPVWNHLSMLNKEVREAYMLGREDAEGEQDV